MLFYDQKLLVAMDGWLDFQKIYLSQPLAMFGLGLMHLLVSTYQSKHYTFDVTPVLWPATTCLDM